MLLYIPQESSGRNTRLGIKGGTRCWYFSNVCLYIPVDPSTILFFQDDTSDPPHQKKPLYPKPYLNSNPQPFCSFLYPILSLSKLAAKARQEHASDCLVLGQVLGAVPRLLFAHLLWNINSAVRLRNPAVLSLGTAGSG